MAPLLLAKLEGTQPGTTGREGRSSWSGGSQTYLRTFPGTSRKGSFYVKRSSKMPYTRWHWLLNEAIKYLALMMDLQDAILMNTPQQLLAEGNDK